MKLEGAAAVFDALQRANVRYVVVGGLAVLAHGYLRFTKDIDLVIQLVPDNIRRTFRALEEFGYRPSVPVTADQFADRPTRERWVLEKHMRELSLWCPTQEDTPVDLFVTEPFDFDKEYGVASRRLLFERIEVRVALISTLIEMKQATTRPVDLLDVEQLRRMQEPREPA